MFQCSNVFFSFFKLKNNMLFYEETQISSKRRMAVDIPFLSIYLQITDTFKYTQKNQGHWLNHIRHGSAHSGEVRSVSGLVKLQDRISISVSIQIAGRSTPNQYLNRDYEDLSETLLESLHKLERKPLFSTVQMMSNINSISKTSYKTSTENMRHFFRRGDLLYTCTLMIILNQCVSLSGPEGVPRHRACAV